MQGRRRSVRAGILFNGSGGQITVRVGIGVVDSGSAGESGRGERGAHPEPVNHSSTLTNPQMHPPEMIGSVRLSSSEPKSTVSG